MGGEEEEAEQTEDGGDGNGLPCGYCDGPRDGASSSGERGGRIPARCGDGLGEEALSSGGDLLVCGGGGEAFWCGGGEAKTAHWWAAVWVSEVVSFSRGGRIWTWIISEKVTDPRGERGDSFAGLRRIDLRALVALWPQNTVLSTMSAGEGGLSQRVVDTIDEKR